MENLGNFIELYKEVDIKGVHEKTRFGSATVLRNKVVTTPPFTFPARRGSKPSIGIIEGLQFIAGTAEMEPFRVAAPNARLDLFGLSSFYGPRTAAQFPRIIEELRRNRNSRRAVLQVAHPDDSPDTVPCTLNMQFQITPDNKLHTVVTMRSSDLVWGMPYDLIQFTMVACAMQYCTSSVLDTITVNTANAHIYEASRVPAEDWDYYKMIIDGPSRGQNKEWSDWVWWAKNVLQQELSGDLLVKQFGVYSVK